MFLEKSIFFSALPENLWIKSTIDRPVISIVCLPNPIDNQGRTFPLQNLNQCHFPAPTHHFISSHNLCFCVVSAFCHYIGANIPDQRERGLFGKQDNHIHGGQSGKHPCPVAFSNGFFKDYLKFLT